MRCHYEIFEVERTATTEDIKKQYKRLALKYHPDRNHGNEAEAAERFKEVSTAYAVLVDPQERKWYDDHRESILRGGSGGRTGSSASEDESDEYVMNLWPFFNGSCYNGFDESDSKCFYAVYRNVFSSLESYEHKCGDINIEFIPNFGDTSTNSKDVIFFYNYWTNFASRMSFSWEDKYNPNEAPDRAVRRLIEKENKVLRDNARKEYNELVRNLANFCKKRDPRIEAILNEVKMKKEAEELKRLNAKKEEKERKRLLREKNRLLDEENERLQQEQEENETNGGSSSKKDALKAFRLADYDDDDYVDRYGFCGEDGDGEDDHCNGTGSSKSSGKGASSQKQSRKKGSEQQQQQQQPQATAEADAEPIVVDGQTATDDQNGNQDQEEGEDDQEEVVQEFVCEICNRAYKSEAQLAQHLTSKLHKTNEKLASRKANSSKKGSNKGSSSKKGAASSPAAVGESLEALNII